MKTIAWCSWETKFGPGFWRVYEDAPDPHRVCEELVRRSEAEAAIARAWNAAGRIEPRDIDIDDGC